MDSLVITIKEILEYIPQHKEIYVLFCGFITGIAMFIIGILNRKNEDQKNKIIKYIITFVLCVIGSTVTFAISTYYPVEPDPVLPKGWTYDIYDENEISKRIKAINSDLSDEGKQIKEEDLKAFIYAMNEDYSLINQDMLIEVTNIIANVDADIINILRGGIQVDDQHTSTMSFAEIFSHKSDKKFVMYWCQKYDKLVNDIYEYGVTSYVIDQIDKYNLELYDTFLNHEPIVIDGEKMSDMSVSEEALYFSTICVNRNVPFMMVNIDGGNREASLPTEIIDGEQATIDIQVLYEELQNYNYEKIYRMNEKFKKKAKDD